MTSRQPTFYEQELERICAQRELRKNLYNRVMQTRQFMQVHLSEKIELEAIAASAAMSRFHFIRVFQQIYGVRPRQFLKDMGIARAKELISTGLTITQVCYEVGYESLTTFSGTFKRGTGLSPNAYRKRQVSNREEVIQQISG